MQSAPGVSILECLARHAGEHAGTAAVVSVAADGRTRSLSWGELAREVERVAALLASLGVRTGEPVAYQLPNRLEFVTISLAILRIGAVCEPLMPIFRERELTFMLRRSGARVLLVPSRFRGTDHRTMALGIQAECPELEHIITLDGDYEQLVAGADPAALAGRRPALTGSAQLLFTSGSTGEPKGVLHRHDVLNAAAAMHAAHFGLDAEDVIYIPSPLAHQTGFLYGMWIALWLGATQIAQEVWDAAIGLATMRRCGVTFVQAATPFLADLVAEARARGEVPGALRIFVATGAAVPRELAHAARTVLGAEVGGAFGTTESCLGAAFVPGDPAELAAGTDGRALDGVTLRIVDDAGAPLAPGVEGNFEVLTPTLFEGYLDREDLTAEALTADGYYRTGDLARIDDDGYLRITGRVKDVINRGGEKVPVAEIEQLLYSHPAVSEVAIVAMPDARLGERACAFVVPAAGAELRFDEMQQYLDSRAVAKTYWPERLELVDSLPRTPSGKVQKYVLRERVARLPAGKAVMR